MEYCESGDLSFFIQRMKKENKLILEEKIWKIFIQLCIGLFYLHKKKILHRDLKTQNIFIAKEKSDEVIKIGDLGVAKALSHTTFANTFVGTPYYLSPEICEEKPYNEKSDIWALGCILYQMCTFQHPCNAKNQAALILKILTSEIQPIDTEVYSMQTCKIINTMLEKNHFKRPKIEELLKNENFLQKCKQYGLYEVVLIETGRFPMNSNVSTSNLVNNNNNVVIGNSNNVICSSNSKNKMNRINSNVSNGKNSNSNNVIKYQ